MRCRRRVPLGLRLTVVVALIALCTAGCSSRHSTLNPFGPDAGRINALSWFMIALSSLITLFVFTLLVVGLFRRRRATRERGGSELGLVVYAGIVMPAIVLLTLAGLTIVTLNRSQDPPRALAVEVVGHQWWWEVRYPGTAAVTANEIHIPVGRQIRFTLRADDVIHSFWVPSLAQKVDMIPGRTNHLVLRADEAGSYRGQCAEFCGLQHAKMAFVVIAQPPAAFAQWLHGQAAPASAVSGAAAAGRSIFLSQACGGCHTVRGTPAQGTVGPDLTHLASRSTLAAYSVPNRGDVLRRWITDAQSIKPGARMPPIPISNSQANAIVAYLQQLR